MIRYSIDNVASKAKFGVIDMFLLSSVTMCLLGLGYGLNAALSGLGW